MPQQSSCKVQTVRKPSRDDQPRGQLLPHRTSKGKTPRSQQPHYCCPGGPVHSRSLGQLKSPEGTGPEGQAPTSKNRARIQPVPTKIQAHLTREHHLKEMEGVSRSIPNPFQTRIQKYLNPELYATLPEDDVVDVCAYPSWTHPSLRPCATTIAPFSSTVSPKISLKG